MKVTIPEIAWHNRDPVFSADFSPADGQSWRMATAGADADVKVKREWVNFVVGTSVAA